VTLALSDSDILSIWEAGRGSTPVERALLLLYPVTSDREVEQWPIGRRDARLFAVYAATFGPTVEGVTTCPECGERLDVSFPVDAMRNSDAPSTDLIEVPVHDPTYRVAVRLPSSADLQRIVGLPDLETARRTLAHACIVCAERNGEAVAPAALPSGLIDEIDAALALHDTQAHVGLSMNCPACRHTWGITFDIADFLWRVLSDRAKRVVVDVHVLARSYGWSEEAILRMSPARRALYGELIW
jgi:hypothetical protein